MACPLLKPKHPTSPTKRGLYGLGSNIFYFLFLVLGQISLFINPRPTLKLCRFHVPSSTFIIHASYIVSENLTPKPFKTKKISELSWDSFFFILIYFNFFLVVLKTWWYQWNIEFKISCQRLGPLSCNNLVYVGLKDCIHSNE